jgi:hypothetical protein
VEKIGKGVREMDQSLQDLQSQRIDDQVVLTPAERGEEFRVPTNGIANTDPSDMPQDAFEAWVGAIEITNPMAAKEWREKRARAGVDRVSAVEAHAPNELEEPDESGEQSEQSASVAPQGEKTLAAEPYDFDRCTITIGIQLLPIADGSDPSERQVIVGVRNHNDPPIIRFATLAEITSPVVIANLLAQLRAEFPVREQARREREAKARAEEEARQQKLAAMKAKREKKRSNPLMAAPPPASAIVSTSGATLPQAPATAPAPSHTQQQSLF